MKKHTQGPRSKVQVQVLRRDDPSLLIELVKMAVFFATLAALTILAFCL